MSVKHSGGSKLSTFKGNKTPSTSHTAGVCDYCHMTGHIKDKCFCLHGYPNWHRIFGKPKPKPRLNLSNAGTRPVTTAQVNTMTASGAAGAESFTWAMQATN